MSIFNFHGEGFPSSTNCAFLHLKRKGLSLFFTITDLEFQVVASFSLGQVSESRNRRIKCSLMTIDRLIIRMRSVFRKHSISKVTVLLRSSFRWQLRNLERLLSEHAIEIVALENAQRTTHGPMRAPKKPRK